MKRYKFSLDELDVEQDAFVKEFVQKIITEYGITQKWLDKAYSELIDKWDRGYSA